MQWLIEQAELLSKNPIFAGLFGGSIVATALFALRQVPSQLWTLVKWRYTCSIAVLSEDSAYERVNEWLVSLDYTQKCRNMRLVTTYDHELQEERENMVPGFGNHWFWYKGRPIWVTRKVPEKGGIGGWKRFEDIDIMTVGSDPAILRVLLAEIRAARDQAKQATINVYLYRHRWQLACRKPKRTLESVVLPDSVKTKVVKDVDRFLKRRSWYQARGVPYRRSLMLEGPPGCGKTSLVLALASHLGRPIYALNLGSLAGDDSLIDAVCEVPENGILLIEDIDVAKATASRVKAPDTKAVDPSPSNGAPPPPTAAPEGPREVSLSALLNVIDGAFSREGRLMIMTTNHPELIDPALLRPGRSDLRVRVLPLEQAEALTMARRFLETELEARRALKDVVLPIPAAVLQERLLGWTDSQESVEAPASKVLFRLEDADRDRCC